MRKLVVIAALMASSAALAQQAPPPPVAGFALPVTLTGEEVQQLLTDLPQSELLVRQPDGAIRPYVASGAQAAMQMLQRKEMIARADADKERRAKADADQSKDAPKPPAPAEPAK